LTAPRPHFDGGTRLRARTGKFQSLVRDHQRRHFPRDLLFLPDLARGLH
jgi:hypothetical protein